MSYIYSDTVQSTWCLMFGLTLKKYMMTSPVAITAAQTHCQFSLWVVADLSEHWPGNSLSLCSLFGLCFRLCFVLSVGFHDVGNLLELRQLVLQVLNAEQRTWFSKLLWHLAPIDSIWCGRELKHHELDKGLQGLHWCLWTMPSSEPPLS